MMVFLILSFLEILAERHRKSISVEFNFATVFAFKHHVSATFVVLPLNTNVVADTSSLNGYACYFTVENCPFRPRIGTFKGICANVLAHKL